MLTIPFRDKNGLANCFNSGEICDPVIQADYLGAGNIQSEECPQNEGGECLINKLGGGGRVRFICNRLDLFEYGNWTLPVSGNCPFHNDSYIVVIMLR